jgi:hypothetical protein
LIKPYNLGCKISTFGNIQALKAIIHHYKLEDADKKTTLKCGIWTTIVQSYSTSGTPAEPRTDSFQFHHPGSVPQDLALLLLWENDDERRGVSPAGEA